VELAGVEERPATRQYLVRQIGPQECFGVAIKLGVLAVQHVEHAGIKFWCVNAGHVLGAAMFVIEIAGVRVLYTGDFSR
jgi:predicted metal-dependent RNase